MITMLLSKMEKRTMLSNLKTKTKRNIRLQKTKISSKIKMINQHKMVKQKKKIQIMRPKHPLVKMILTNKINKPIKILKIKGRTIILKIKIPKTVNNNRQMMINKKRSIRRLIKAILIKKLRMIRRKVMSKLKHLMKRPM